MMSNELIHFCIHQPYYYLKIFACICVLYLDYTRKKSMFFMFSYFTVFQIIYSFILFKYGYNVLMYFVYFLVNIPILLALFYISKFKDSRTVFSFFFIEIVSAVINFVSYFSFLKIFPETNIYYTICRIVSIFIMLIFFIKFYIPKIKPLLLCKDVNWKMISLVLIIVNLYMNYEVFVKGPIPERQDELFNIAIIFLLIMFITLILLLVIKQSNSIFEKNKALEIMQIYVNQAEKSNSNILNTYEKIRYLRHDINKHYVILTSLVSEHKYESARKYLFELSSIINNEKTIFFTSNFKLNSIINFYYEKMLEKNIKFKYKINIENIAEEYLLSLCIILGNALENAVESCNGDRLINLNMINKGNQLYIDLDNTHIGTILIQDNCYISNKSQNTDSHGLGINIIKKIVEKNNGWCDFRKNDNLFTFKAIYNLY